jgi:hypothetical protein
MLCSVKLFETAVEFFVAYSLKMKMKMKMKTEADIIDNNSAKLVPEGMSPTCMRRFM